MTTSIPEAGGPAAGVLDRIRRAWRGPRPAAEAELASGAEEPRLLAYAMGGCLVLWLAQTPDHVFGRMQADAAAGQATDVAMLVTANLVSMLFFTPLMLYGIAALARIVLRLFGGAGGWFASRHMVFWSLIVAAPAILLGGLLTFAADLLGAGRWAGLPLVLANLVWLRFWAEGLAAAHGFRSGLAIFGVMAAAAAALSFATPGALAAI
ncbi:MAG: YIP1 family protein [Pseudomonadota bacterium]